MARVLNSRNNLSRLKRTCFAASAALFDETFQVVVPLLVVWQWGSIQATLREVLTVYLVLQSHWSLEVYMQGSTQHATIRDLLEEEVDDDTKRDQMGYTKDLHLMDEALKYRKFHAICQLLHALQHLLTTVDGCAGGCPCHGSYLKEIAGSTR